MYNIEWRQNGIIGPTLGYIPRNMRYLDLWIQPGQYVLFPVFKYFNPVRNQINTIYPTMQNNEGRTIYWFTAFNHTNPAITIQLNASDAITALGDTRTLGAAWMVVNNATNIGLEVRFGNVLLTDPMGYSIINPSNPTEPDRAIQIDMAAVAGTFATERLVSGIKIGIGGIDTDLRDADGNTSFTLSTDYQYSINVTGSIAGLTAIINLNGTKIQFN
jgi:hypothetical protein